MARVDQLYGAYDFFNMYLFDNKLDKVYISIDDNEPEYSGHYRPKALKMNGLLIDAITLNDRYFYDNYSVLNTLVHEMVHKWELDNYAKPLGMHSLRWSNKMKNLGIIPKETGKCMIDKVLPDGQFSKIAADLIEAGFNIV